MPPVATPATLPIGALPTNRPGNTPLGRPPPGHTANLEHPYTNASRVYVAAGVCIPLILIFAAIRAYNKLYLNRGRSWDDYASMLATVCGLIYISLCIAMVSEGLFGIHIWDLTVSDLRNSPFLLVLIIEALWGPFIWIIKLALFLLYLKLFERFLWFRPLIWGGITVTGLFYFSILITDLVLCAPRAHETYINAFSTPRCNLTKKVGVASGGFNIVTDAYLLALPCIAVSKIQIDPKKKMGVMMGFSAGIMALIASILGLWFRLRVNNDVDNTWNVMPLHLALIVEMTCGLAVLCGPSLCCIVRSERFGKFVKKCKDLTKLSGSSNEASKGSRMRMASLGVGVNLQDQHAHGHKPSTDSHAQLNTHGHNPSTDSNAHLNNQDHKASTDTVTQLNTASSDSDAITAMPKI
ncbi:MAG: hypothetical protein Q9208_001038 [Pyrenodesmia sp. 3 TL-2023]